MHLLKIRVPKTGPNAELIFYHIPKHKESANNSDSRVLVKHFSPDKPILYEQMHEIHENTGGMPEICLRDVPDMKKITYRNLFHGCVSNAQSWVFFPIFKI